MDYFKDTFWINSTEVNPGDFLIFENSSKNKRCQLNRSVRAVGRPSMCYKWSGSGPVWSFICLPSTQFDRDRYMWQDLHDITATSCRLAHPDIFLNMTCNPNWSEMTIALLPSWKAPDWHDLCFRVFHIKSLALLAFVIDENVFREVIADVRGIRFPK